MTDQTAAPATTPRTVAVTVRFFAAARAAARVERLGVELEGTVATVDDLVAALGAGNPELARVLLRCSFLVDEVVVRDSRSTLHDGAVLDVLPPFAGG